MWVPFVSLNCWLDVCEIDERSGRERVATDLVGLPLLGSPLVISDPSVATYDLLRLAYIAGRCVESV